ncbi:MAG: rhodanese [Bacteroidetes bacterium]|nr:MAG: rhodanese [Bacteroidota bacterium]
MLFLLAAVPSVAQLDFKNDSTVYKTMYQDDLCDFLRKNPQALLIDVRSPGEFSDTSRYGSLNIGHLKGAINIPIDSVSKNMDLLKSKSDQPIVLYCSHSQRSRRVSKTLTENGFTQVWNLNGGMSRMNQAGEKDFPCKEELIVSSLPYGNLPADEAIALIKKTPGLLIIDVRTVAEFEGTDTAEYQNIGRIKNAVNIPAAEMKEKMAGIDKSKTILVYDDNGARSNHVAKMLYENGYTKVKNLLGGLSEVIEGTESATSRKEILERMPAYNILNVRETVSLITKGKDVVIIDVRTAVEFSNKSEKLWHNVGHIKNAINIPQAELNSSMSEISKYRNSTVIVCGGGGGDGATCSKALKDAGLRNVNLVYDGMWGLVSASFNVKDMKEIKSLLVDHDGLY